MKRPTKAEKVSRSINEAPYSRRELSPDYEGPRSAIPLFNSSAKRHASRLGEAEGLMSLDSSKAPTPEEREMEVPMGEEDTVGDGGKLLLMKKKSLKDKISKAREGLKESEERSREKVTGKAKGKGTEVGKGKVGVLGGVDYLKLHASRPGGSFKKKLR